MTKSNNFTYLAIKPEFLNKWIILGMKVRDRPIYKLKFQINISTKLCLLGPKTILDM